MGIVNISRNVVLASKLRIANDFWARTKGLIGEKKLESSSALLIPDCSSIHTFFMSVSIDVLFFNSANKIVRAVPKLAPYRFSFGPRETQGVIELPTGTLADTKTEVGDILLIQEEN